MKEKTAKTGTLAVGSNASTNLEMTGDVGTRGGMDSAVDTRDVQEAEVSKHLPADASEKEDDRDSDDLSVDKNDQESHGDIHSIPRVGQSPAET